MTDEIKMHRQKTRGAQAESLWQNPILQEFFADVENKVKDALFTSSGEDAELRERCYLMMRLLGNLKEQCQLFINTGKIASHALLEIEKEKKRA